MPIKYLGLVLWAAAVLTVTSCAEVDRRYPPMIAHEDAYSSPSHEQKMWALATCAVLTESNKDRHDLLGFCERTPQEVAACEKSLERWWGIRDRNDLVDVLEWIEEGGHRRRFDELARYLIGLSSEEVLALRRELGEDPEILNRLDVVIEFREEFGEKSITAWDYDRYVALCGWGYLCGYLSEDEAWATIMPAARLLQRTFDSWEDLGRNHVIGRRFWSLDQTNKRGPLTQHAYESLLTAPTSPWNSIPWDLDLGSSLHVHGIAE